MLRNQTTREFHPSSYYAQEYRRLEKQLAGATFTRLNNLRQAALIRFSQQDFPTKKEKGWEYTPLHYFLQSPFSFHPGLLELNKELQTAFEPSQTSYRLVFINGIFSPSFSTVALLPSKAIIGSLAHLIHTNIDQLFNTWQPSSELDKNSFINLNTGFMHDGAYIYLPANISLTSPLELIFMSTHENDAFIPIRNIIIMEEGSQAVIIEKYIHLKENRNRYFTNTVTECFLAKNSRIEHYKRLEESENAIHIGNLFVEQHEKSQFSAYSIALKGALVRSDVNVRLLQSYASCHLKGLYWSQGKQHIGHHTTIDHLGPYTTSEEFYKGIIDNKAHAVFDGTLRIRQKAIKSQAKQLNKNLLLSPSAEIYTKPQLEIFTDDTQCTHGASIGQLDETALFYLRARGLSAIKARNILVKAFIRDIIQQMPLLSTEASLSNSLRNRIVTDDEML